jgi:hypothetical protein
MKYFRAKEVVKDNTTLSLRTMNQEKMIHYHADEDVNYFGVETEDVESFLAAQPAEIEATELTFAEIKSILDDCRMMKDFNTMIENQIAEKYSVGREFKMRDLPATDPERVEYESFKESVKVPIRLKKLEFGLV